MAQQQSNVELRSQARNRDTFRPISEKRAVPQSGASQTINTLNDILPGIIGEATGELQATIQEDKTLQAARAYAGEIAPTDDATTAGRQAFRDVTTRNGVVAEQTELMYQAQNFEGSSPETRDQEWEDILSASQKAAVDKYGASSEDILYIGELYRDFIPKVTETYVAGSLARETQDRIVAQTGTFLSSVTTSELEGNTTEENIAVYENLFEEGESLQLQPSQIRQALIEATVMQLAQGDNALLELTKSAEIDVYRTSSQLQQAERQYNQQRGSEEQADLGLRFSNLNDTALQTNMSKSDYFTQAGELKTSGDIPYISRQEMESRWNQIQGQKDGAFSIDRSLASFKLRGNDPANKSGGHFQTASSAEKDKVMKEYDEEQKLELGTWLRDNPDATDEQKATFVGTQNATKAIHLANNGHIDSTWKQEFATFVGMDLTKLTEEEDIPVIINRVLAVWDSIPEVARQAHDVDGKTDELITNYKHEILSGATHLQAIQNAQTGSLRPKATQATLDNDLTSSINDAIESQLDSKWYQFGFGVDAPEGQKKRVTDAFTERTLFLSRGHRTAEQAVEQTKREFFGDDEGTYQGAYGQLSSGEVFAGNINAVAKHLGIDTNKADDLLVNFASRVASEEMDDFRIETNYPDPEDWLVSTNNEGFVTLVDPDGRNVIPALHLRELLGISLPQMEREALEKREKLTADRIRNAKRMSETNPMPFTGNQFMGELRNQ